MKKISNFLRGHDDKKIFIVVLVLFAFGIKCLVKTQAISVLYFFLSFGLLLKKDLCRKATILFIILQNLVILNSFFPLMPPFNDAEISMAKYNLSTKLLVYGLIQGILIFFIFILRNPFVHTSKYVRSS